MLTREQIDDWRRSFGGGSIDFHALCDLALRGLDDRRDAERYRWLRDTANSVEINECLIYARGPQMINAAIDRAMAEGREGE